MSIFNSFASRAIAVALIAVGLSSCSKNDPEDVTLCYDFDFPADIYNTQGYWKDVYNTEDQYQNFLVSSTNGAAVAAFSHQAQATEWDGVTYRSYTGFCPSYVNDNRDHSADGWVDYQWSAMMTSPINSGYLIAHWDVNDPEDKRSCAIEFADYVVPHSMAITNTAWTFWAIKNGTQFSRPFGPDDVLTLTVHGVNNGVEVSQLDIKLAYDGKIIDNWATVSLESLGQCTGMYFTMTSTDSGQFGMNTPAYFAIDDLCVTYVVSK